MSEQTFENGEKVLCYHGPLIYEAKIIETITDKGQLQHKVHYKGWKQTWDEYVPADRVLKFNDSNLDLQKELQKKAVATQTGNKAAAKVSVVAGSTARNARDKTAPRGQKRPHEDDTGARQAHMRLNVPETLKCQLVDDWEAVTKSQATVKLPRKPTVEQILADFQQHIIDTKPAGLKEPEILARTVVNGIQVYFDKALGSQLLYRFERMQYSLVREKYFTGSHVKVETRPELSQIYGAEHLLRMLVALPQMVSQSTLDTDSMMLLRDYINELLIYLGDRKEQLFQKDYEQHTPTYQNTSRS